MYQEGRGRSQRSGLQRRRPAGIHGQFSQLDWVRKSAQSEILSTGMLPAVKRPRLGGFWSRPCRTKSLTSQGFLRISATFFILLAKQDLSLGSSIPCCLKSWITMPWNLHQESVSLPVPSAYVRSRGESQQSCESCRRNSDYSP